MKTTLSVSAIENGTVIDHIPTGKAHELILLLKLESLGQPMTIGTHLPSKKQGKKDLIKIQGEHLPDFLIEGIAILAPDATVSLIRSYDVVSKMKVSLPEVIHGLLKCPNNNCITHFEPVKTRFHTEAFGKKVLLCCDFCERVFQHEENRR